MPKANTSHYKALAHFSGLSLEFPSALATRGKTVRSQGLHIQVKVGLSSLCATHLDPYPSEPLMWEAA